MRVLDIDMDYFMDKIADDYSQREDNRLLEDEFGNSVWSESRVMEFLENNLGLSKENKIPGRILTNHNEALLFWEERIQVGELQDPFEVIHVDSHADLGKGTYLFNLLFFDDILTLSKKERRKIRKLCTKDNEYGIWIGNYLLWAIAYQYISKLVCCSNPKRIDSQKNINYDVMNLLHKEPLVRLDDDTFGGYIQLQYCPQYYDVIFENDKIRENSTKDPEVEYKFVPTIEGVKYDGNFDFVSLAQSPNFTPKSADFILDIFKEYIIQI